MGVNRAIVQPRMLIWARERAGLDLDELTERIPQLPSWESGDRQPTVKQLEDFARKTHVSFGLLFLSKPPVEEVPIADFRTPLGENNAFPLSPNLLDTIYSMQSRQCWLRANRIDCGEIPISIVGSSTLADSPELLAKAMRSTLELDHGWAKQTDTWASAVGELRRRIERIGVMAVINGVVGNNTHRKLDISEFRGFALCDSYAPLIFVNGTDAKSAQIFTLAYELAHVWLGRLGEGISELTRLQSNDNEIETFCDRAAAEFLLPALELSEHWPKVQANHSRFQTLARQFKVSPTIVARRALDLQFISRTEYVSFFDAYTRNEQRRKLRSGGGNFYGKQDCRVGRLFATEAIKAALEGRLSFRDAYRLTQLHSITFDKYAMHLGFDLK